MILAGLRSPLPSWLLCLAVLLGVQFCALQHGQAGGLALSGLQGGYCSADRSGFAPFAVERGGPDGEWSCPLCQGAATAADPWPPDMWLRGDTTTARPGRRATRHARRRHAPGWPRAP